MAGNCVVGLLVGGMRTVTAHAADQSPRTDPSHWRDTGTPDLFGHLRKTTHAISPLSRATLSPEDRLEPVWQLPELRVETRNSTIVQTPMFPVHQKHTSVTTCRGLPL